MKKVSVIVLVYYNEEYLPLLFSGLAKVESQLGEQDLELELIFVDDGSGDASLKELLKIKQQRESGSTAGPAVEKDGSSPADDAGH